MHEIHILDVMDQTCCPLPVGISDRMCRHLRLSDWHAIWPTFHSVNWVPPLPPSGCCCCWRWWSNRPNQMNSSESPASADQHVSSSSSQQCRDLNSCQRYHCQQHQQQMMLIACSWCSHLLRLNWLFTERAWLAAYINGLASSSSSVAAAAAGGRDANSSWRSMSRAMEAGQCRRADGADDPTAWMWPADSMGKLRSTRYHVYTQQSKQARWKNYYLPFNARALILTGSSTIILVVPSDCNIITAQDQCFNAVRGPAGAIWTGLSPNEKLSEC